MNNCCFFFAAELSQRLYHSSVRSYLSTVCHLHILKGFWDPLKGSLRISIKRPAEIQAKYKGHTSANHSIHGEDHKRCVGQRSFKLWQHSVMGDVLSEVLRISVIWGNYNIPRSVWPMLAFDSTRPGSRWSSTSHDLESAPKKLQDSLGLICMLGGPIMIYA